MQKIVAANWKMHGTLDSARALVTAIEAHLREGPPERADIVLCPPGVLIRAVQAMLADPCIRLGGQDCHAQAQGAFTGDVSAPMLKEAGCTHVIVGHSERRAHHGETDAQVRAKAEAALSVQLIPIICVGESREERAQGQAAAVVAAQVKACLPAPAPGKPPQQGGCVFAYEPVWAIGTGLTPTPEEIGAMHRNIKDLLPDGTPVLYGGSVKAANAAEIFATAGVDGALVGGASLDVRGFFEIVSRSRPAAV